MRSLDRLFRKISHYMGHQYGFSQRNDGGKEAQYAGHTRGLQPSMIATSQKTSPRSR